MRRLKAATLRGSSPFFLPAMWPYPRILAHRGGGTLAPENTLAALRCALAHGFHAVEFDVMLAKDGVPVVVHDPVLGRTVAGCGSVAEYTSGELAGMEAGAWFGAAFAGEPVPSLEQVWRFCMRHGIWMNIELKPAPGSERATGAAVAGLAAAWLAAGKRQGQPHAAQALPLLSSFSHEALEAARNAAPGIPRALLMPQLAADWRERLLALEAVAAHVQHAGLSRAQAAAVKQAGFGLLCYTVNEVARARELLAWGVDALCTDRLDLIGPERV